MGSSAFLSEYAAHVEERSKEAGGVGIAPLPLSASQVQTLLDELRAAGEVDGSVEELLYLLSERVPPGVDEAAYVKAAFLSAVATGSESSPHVSRIQAVEWLGTMQGGYNVSTLVELLEDADGEIAEAAAKQLSQTLLVFDAFYDVQAMSEKGCAAATKVLESWANAEWFLNKPEVAEKMTATVFKVSGETNTGTFVCFFCC